MKKPALLVIDMIEDGFDGWDLKGRMALTASINDLVAFFRAKRFPVIWVRQEFAPDLHDAFLEMRKHGIRKYIAGTEGTKILSEFDVLKDEKVIVKKRYSAFFGTELDQYLAELKPDSLILAGINTHACIRTTAIDAYQRDWETVLAADCVSSHNRAWHDDSLNYMVNKIAGYLKNEEIRSLLAE
jgi:maleamate amidohydrolase